MKIILYPAFQVTVTEIAEYIDGVNTEGAGERWTHRIIDFISGYA